MPAQYFRAGAGAVIIDDEGKVLAFERTDSPGSWQLPQGGLDEGEEPLAAARRESREETGIPENRLEHLASHPDLLAYELPGSARKRWLGRGQVHYWYLFRFMGSPSDINPDAGGEFRAWKWIRMEDLIAEVVEFRKAVYSRVRDGFSRHLS
jgi:putative (di)nucleoside polyphosphate hydrolase